MSSITGQLEELYMANSRKDMNETLTSILMNACVTAVAMPARLMMEHILLVSVLHHTVGTEVILGAGTNTVEQYKLGSVLILCLECLFVSDCMALNSICS